MSDREELIRFFEPNLPAVMGDPDEDGNGFGQFDTIRATGLADAILASDWLAAHDEAIRAEERERIATAIESIRDRKWSPGDVVKKRLVDVYNEVIETARTTEEGA